MGLSFVPKTGDQALSPTLQSSQLQMPGQEFRSQLSVTQVMEGRQHSNLGPCVL